MQACWLRPKLSWFLSLAFMGIVAFSSSLPMIGQTSLFAAEGSDPSADLSQAPEELLTLTYGVASRSCPDKKIEMHLRRFRRDGAPPIILSHAVVLTNLAMRRLGLYLWQAGFDVWLPNMRGHGNGEETTKVEPYEKGDYHFDFIVAQDWPRLLTHVYQTTQKKVHVIGYSMGAMTWEQCLSGVYLDESGHIGQDDAIAKERHAMTQSFTAMVMPADLNHVTAFVKVALYPLLPVLTHLHSWIPFTTARSSQPQGLLEWARRAAIGKLTPLMLAVLAPTIVGRAQLSEDSAELTQLAREEISSPHSDYVSDLVSWFLEAYASRDGAVNYEQNKKIRVPMLLVVASDDGLAPAEYTIERSFAQPAEAQVRILYLEGYSHMDIAFAKAVPLLGPALESFLRMPASFGPVGVVKRLGGRPSAVASR